MINLILINKDVFVFDVKDWEILRKEYRITGELVGNYNLIPTLPLKLSPEEVNLLVRKNVAKIVKCEYERNDTENALMESEQKIYRALREKQLETMIDKIIAQKRNKGDTRSKDEIFRDELDKSSKVTSNNLIWPVLTKAGNASYSDAEYDLLQQTTLLKCEVFRDLWERGYCITGGGKFGGDFLVYKGDPIIYHAIFIVKCVDDIEKALPARNIVAFGRLGTSVKKRAVFASLSDGTVTYLTINWIDE